MMVNATSPTFTEHYTLFLTWAIFASWAKYLGTRLQKNLAQGKIISIPWGEVKRAHDRDLVGSGRCQTRRRIYFPLFMRG